MQLSTVKFEKRIGGGLSGQVYQVHYGQHTLACKVIKKLNPDFWPREIDFLGSYQHPNVVHMVGYHQDENNFYLFTPLYPQDLYAYLEQQGALHERMARSFMKQIVDTLIDLEDHGYAHGDIKDENMMVDGKSIKLIDFGSVLPIDQPRPTLAFVGTIQYAPPEVLSKQDVYWPGQADLWALGCLLYIMVTGKLPFRSAEQAIHDPFTPAHLSPACSNLLGALLHKDAHQRPALTIVARHPWFQDM